MLSTQDIDFETMQSIARFARYWDMVANSGRFPNSLPLILGEQPFQQFMKFSDWLFQTTDQTHRISLQKLFTLIFDALISEFKVDKDMVVSALQKDYQRSGLKGLPAFLKSEKLPLTLVKNARKGSKRQQRHYP